MITSLPYSNHSWVEGPPNVYYRCPKSMYALLLILSPQSTGNMNAFDSSRAD